jgi:hypothetical protein
MIESKGTRDMMIYIGLVVLNFLECLVGLT